MLCRVEILEIIHHKARERVVASRYAVANELTDIHEVAAALCRSHGAGGYRLHDLHTDEITEIWDSIGLKAGRGG